MTLEEARNLVERPLQNMLPMHIEVLTPMLAKLHATVLCASGKAAFITSDAPCVWFDPEAYKRPPMYRAPALMYPTLEITLPLSPDRALLLSRQEPADNFYLDIPDPFVDELNRRTRGYAEEEFVARTPEANPLWYDVGELPDDGWTPPARQDRAR
jgi:hypothetical protein